MNNIFTFFSKNKKLSVIALIIILLVIVFLVSKNNDKNTRTEPVITDVGNVESALGEDFVIYNNQEYNFSLSVYRGSEEKKFSDNDGDVFVLTAPQRDFTFQIFITSFDSNEEVITSSMIAKDLPGVRIENPQEAILGDNIRALIFFIDNEGLGKTREVWFIKNRHLYQITTFADSDSLLAGILSTLDFK